MYRSLYVKTWGIYSESARNLKPQCRLVNCTEVVKAVISATWLTKNKVGVEPEVEWNEFLLW